MTRTFLPAVVVLALVGAAAVLVRAGRGRDDRVLWFGAAVFLVVTGLLRVVLGEWVAFGVWEALWVLALFAVAVALRRNAAAAHRSAEKMAAVRAELTRGEQRYRFLVDRLPEAFAVLSEEGGITFANRAFGKIFGVGQEAACGRRLEEFIAPEYQGAFRQRHALESTSPSVGMRRLEVEALRAEGSRFWIEMRFATWGFEPAPGEVVLIADVSGRRQADVRLQRLTETLLALTSDHNGNIQTLTALGGELLEASFSAYHRLHGERLVLVGGWRLPPGYEGDQPVHGHLCGDLFRGRTQAGPSVVDRLDESPSAETDPNVRRLGLASFAGVPVLGRERTLGALCVLFQRERKLSSADLRVLQIIASAIGIEEDRRYAHETQRAVTEIAAAVQRTDSMAAFFAAVHAATARLLDAPSFHVVLSDRDTTCLSFPYFFDEQENAPEPRPPGRGLVEYVLRTGRPLLADAQILAELRGQGEVENGEPPWRECLLAPLGDRAGSFGALVVPSYRRWMRFNHKDVEVLALLGDHVASALEHLRAEELLRQSEQKYRMLVDRLQDGMFVLQGKRLVFCNQALGHILGRPLEGLIGREFLELVAPEDRELVLDRYQRRLAGENVPAEYEFRLLHSDGRRRIDVHMHVGVIEYQGRPATLGTVRDLTERKRLEAQLRQAQKIEALGQLAGGVAHDFNNLLQTIQGSAQLLARRAGERLPEELATITAAAQRAGQLTRGLLAFAQRQVLTPQPLDLNRHIQQLMPILRRLIPENIVIDFVPSGCQSVVEVDAGQLDQILINLVVNSRDAMESGGRLEIRIDAVDIGLGYQRTHPWARLGPHVRLQVRDTGVGMDGETLAHIFEPFFTTKSAGRGTGLGLSTVYGIVKQHGGMIDVSSEPGGGTTVDVYLPQVDKPPVEEAPRERVDASGRGERILVVEDEAEVRLILVEALRSAGYEVQEAPDGVAALATLLGGEGEVALVLSDVVMPRMGGKELLEAVRAHGIDVPFLFSSGYGEPFIKRGDEDGEKIAFLAKPYGIEQLLCKVRDVLTAAERRAG